MCLVGLSTQLFPHPVPVTRTRMDPQPAAAPGGTTTPSGAGSSSDPAARRHRISAAIAARRLAQHELISSLQTLVPDLVSSLDLSLRLISAFNHRPLETLTLAPPPRIPSPVSSPRRRPLETLTLTPTPPRSRPRLSPPPSPSGGAAAALVRTMIAVCLLELVPFTEIDSAALLRRLEGEQSSASPAELAALADLSLPLGPVHAVETALRRIAEETGGVQLEEFAVNGVSLLMVWGIDRSKLLKELPETPLEPEPEPDRPPRPDSRLPTPVRVVPRTMGMVGGVSRGMGMPPPLHRPMMGNAGAMGAPSMPEKPRTEEDEMKDIEEMINKKTFKEMQKSKTGEELLDLIHRPTAKETANAAKFKTKGGSQVKEYCHLLTKEDCRRHFSSYLACEKVHFRRIIAAHTDKDLGDCSFLDTCRHTKTCKYVHYELDPTPDIPPTMMGTNQPPKPVKALRAEYCSEVELGEAQWVNCDIRSFRMDILGQFGVIMADPPWDIHMELPYGTMADDEMRTLNVPALQTDGLIFLWVTGRAMELGRECLELWGYKRVEEIIWVKTNQLQRIIRTGRTGHWLNHSKEHCLVGIKGNPEVNRNIDTDVIVAEVRETSRKPDEMYALLERISPRTRKLELFARMHNTQAGWLSLGNQLQGTRLVDEGLRARFKAAYPDVEVQPASPPRIASSTDVDSNTAQARSPFTVTDSKQQGTNSAIDSKGNHQ